MAYKIEIERTNNGFMLTNGTEVNVIEEKDSEFGELFAIRKVLWYVLEFFAVGYDKHRAQNVVIKVVKNRDI